MAKKQYIFFVTLLAAFCSIQTSNAQTAQSVSEVIHLLNSYSKPLNLTMGKKFLSNVHDSEIGLCLNLTNNETSHGKSSANAALASLHVRITNHSSLKSNVFQFPCLNCPHLASTSPNVKFMLNDEAVENMTCLAGSRLAEDFQTTVQSPFRLSDVLSLSVIDGNMAFVNLSEGESVHLQMPLVKLPNSSLAYELMCVAQPLLASRWSSSHCTTSQTLKQDNGTSFVLCNCSTLGYYTVFVQYNNSNGFSPWNYNGGGYGGNPGGAIPTPFTGLSARLSLTLAADCTILSNSTTKADFLNSTKYSIALALNISVNNIVNMVAECGSIIVHFTIISPDGTNATLNAELLEFSNLVRSDSFKVPVGNILALPLTLGITANYNLTIPTNIVSLYYLRITATTPPVTTEEIQPLVVDYTPFMIAVAVILFLIFVCVCGTCCAHSWYLRKRKFTEYNSNKVKPKVEKPVVVEDEEVAPAEFPMTFSERPKVNERQMAKYDWARTSFAHEQNDTSAFVTGSAAVGPRLIMDCDSDDEAESSPTPADVAINMEQTEEEESSEGYGDSTSEEDEYEGEYDPRNYECEDDLSEDGGESRDDMKHEEQNEPHENEESREDKEKDGEAQHTEEGETNEDDQHTDDRQNNEENENPEDDVREDDVREDDDVTKDDDVTEDDVKKEDDVTGEDDLQEDDVKKEDDVTGEDDLQEDDVKKGDDITEDKDDVIQEPEDSEQHVPSRSANASSRMDGVMSRNIGLPEPSM